MLYGLIASSNHPDLLDRAAILTKARAFLHEKRVRKNGNTFPPSVEKSRKNDVAAPR